MANLHWKFLSENPHCRIPLASFNRLRPENVLNARYLGRQACLCIHLQNMSLNMQAGRNLGIPVSSNPEEALSIDTTDLLNEVQDDQEVKYKVWKKVEDEKKAKRMRVVEVTSPKSVYLPSRTSEMSAFRGHVDRLREQYKQIRALKDQLLPHEMIAQMDFSENYMCRSVDEIQSAY